MSGTSNITKNQRKRGRHGIKNSVSRIQAIFLDGNVVAGLAAVTDENLQSATETAANSLIGAPVSYVDLNALANDNTFLRRVQIAVAHFANYILNEQPNTANHPARYAWARNSILNTQGVANALAPAVVMEVLQAILKLRERASILIVEQKIDLVLPFAERAYIMVNGRIAHASDAASLLRDEALQVQLLGV